MFWRECGGTVEHIGYALFSQEQRELIGPTVGHFVERYSLEADLPLQREKTLEVQLMEDGVSFPKGGGLGSLLPLSLDPGLSLKLSELGGRWYLLEWGSFSMTFPSDAELLLGRTRQEDERRLPGELASAPDPVAPPLPSARELSERADHMLEQTLGCYYLPSLNANRYYTASVEPVDAPEYPAETFANVLAGLVDAGENYEQAAVREMHEETGLVFTPLETDPMYQEPRFTTVGLTDESCATVYGYSTGSVSGKYLEASEEIEVVLADREEVRRILKEERVAIMCAYQLMHFLADEEPFRFLQAGEEV